MIEKWLEICCIGKETAFCVNLDRWWDVQKHTNHINLKIHKIVISVLCFPTVNERDQYRSAFVNKLWNQRARVNVRLIWLPRAYKHQFVNLSFRSVCHLFLSIILIDQSVEELMNSPIATHRVAINIHLDIEIDILLKFLSKFHDQEKWPKKRVANTF